MDAGFEDTGRFADDFFAVVAGHFLESRIDVLDCPVRIGPVDCVTGVFDRLAERSKFVFVRLLFRDIHDRAANSDGCSVLSSWLAVGTDPSRFVLSSQESAVELERFPLLDGCFNSLTNPWSVRWMVEFNCLIERRFVLQRKPVDPSNLVGPVERLGTNVVFPSSDGSEFPNCLKQVALSLKSLSPPVVFDDVFDPVRKDRKRLFPSFLEVVRDAGCDRVRGDFFASPASKENER